MKKYNHICRKHNYTKKSAFGGICPICREDLECIGDRKRIGHMGQFNKIERKTRKLSGQEPVITYGFRKRMREKNK